jgi:hypothetical protein
MDNIILEEQPKMKTNKKHNTLSLNPNSDKSNRLRTT